MSRRLPVRPAVVGRRQDDGAARHPARRRPLLGALLVTLFVACVPRAAPAVERVAICHGAFASLLIPLAKRQDFYAAEGVEVDAAAHWEPNIQMLAAEFGVKAKTFSVPGLHVGPFLLLGGRDYLRQNRATVERVLRALIRAEGFAKEQPEKAMTMMMGINVVGRDDVKLVWSVNDFRVTLDQSLLFSLENVARWAIAWLPVVQRPAMPNYLDFIDVDGLLAVKPAAVTIIH
ncbi:hypothetical protein ACCAA_310099 [Candidatus Accumulibacter aalborgensis]|uniref:Uncharacterized protein n=1 Tax=Candidatus Accumulibacter aalborgensis TaxID=1860102 RepID=A0A1A8XMI3_9PROT|nr:hypothetical protein [Candidatus Accumulibacter aalborgensis]SBT06370.1 hypothetical protein ACCAA_310099 [Candidatus Accumulibacter aalborgensis]